MALNIVKKTTSNPDQAVADAVRTAIAVADREVPQFHEAIEKRERVLKPRQGELEQRRDQLLAGLARSVEQATTTGRAEAFLQSGEVQDPARAAGLRDLRSVDDELPVVREAIRLHAGVVSREHTRWSDVICRELGIFFRKLGQRAAAAASEMSAVNATAQALTRALFDADPEAAGAFHGLPSIAFMVPGPRGFREDPFGVVDDPRSGVSVYLAELRELGLI